MNEDSDDEDKPPSLVDSSSSEGEAPPVPKLVAKRVKPTRHERREKTRWGSKFQCGPRCEHDTCTMESFMEVAGFELAHDPSEEEGSDDEKHSMAFSPPKVAHAGSAGTPSPVDAGRATEGGNVTERTETRTARTSKRRRRSRIPGSAKSLDCHAQESVSDAEAEGKFSKSPWWSEKVVAHWLKARQEHMDRLGIDYVVSVDDYDGMASYAESKIAPPEGWQQERAGSSRDCKRWRGEMISMEMAEEARRATAIKAGNSQLAQHHTASTTVVSVKAATAGSSGTPSPDDAGLAVEATSPVIWKDNKYACDSDGFTPLMSRQRRGGGKRRWQTPGQKAAECGCWQDKDSEEMAKYTSVKASHPWTFREFAFGFSIAHTFLSMAV